MSNENKLGQEPAFPCDAHYDANGICGGRNNMDGSYGVLGMSRRLLLAGMAMQGLLAQAQEQHPQSGDMETWNYECIAKCALEAADELLKAESL
jgi:hypothetical protein